MALEMFTLHSYTKALAKLDMSFSMKKSLVAFKCLSFILKGSCLLKQGNGWNCDDVYDSFQSSEEKINMLPCKVFHFDENYFTEKVKRTFFV